MKKIILLLFFMFNALNISGQEQTKIKTSYVKFDFIHSLRIPYNKVTIEVIKRHSKIILKLNSKPLNTDGKWEYSNISKQHEITQEEFNLLLKKIETINYSDLIKHFNYLTLDGYSTTITYGGYSNNISYTLGGPLKSDLEISSDYLSACKYFLELAKLDTKEILN